MSYDQRMELTRKNNELLDRIAFNSSLDFLTRMEGTDGKTMNDLYTRMVGTQQGSLKLNQG